MDWKRIIDAAEQIIVSEGKNKTDLAEILGVRPQYLADVRSGKSKNPGSDFTLALINRMNFNPRWIQTGEGNPFQSNKTMSEALILVKHEMAQEKREEYALFKFSHGHPFPIDAKDTDADSVVLLPVFGQPAAAGSGQSGSQLPDINAYLPIAYEMLGGARPQNCGIVRVIGDSMIDINLFNGDLAIFDRTQLEGNGVYVISVGEEVRVKHLEYRLFEKKIIISSENAKRYTTPEVLSYEQAENLLRVHGKVICWMHKHPY